MLSSSNALTHRQIKPDWNCQMRNSVVTQSYPSMARHWLSPTSPCIYWWPAFACGATDATGVASSPTYLSDGVFFRLHHKGDRTGNSLRCHSLSDAQKHMACICPGGDSLIPLLATLVTRAPTLPIVAIPCLDQRSLWDCSAPCLSN